MNVGVLTGALMSMVNSAQRSAYSSQKGIKLTMGPIIVEPKEQSKPHRISTFAVWPIAKVVLTPVNLVPYCPSSVLVGEKSSRGRVCHLETVVINKPHFSQRYYSNISNGI